jgi:DHA1 family inner membrane transport protein
VAVVLVMWGVVGMGLVPSIQHRVLTLAGPGRNLAATLPASALNLGIALGALAGGGALDGFGAGAPLLAGLAACVVAAPLTVATAVLRPSVSPPPALTSNRLPEGATS